MWLAIFFSGCLAVSLAMFYHLYIKMIAINEHPEEISVVDEAMDNHVPIMYMSFGRGGYLLQNT